MIAASSTKGTITRMPASLAAVMQLVSCSTPSVLVAARSTQDWSTLAKSNFTSVKIRPGGLARP